MSLTFFTTLALFSFPSVTERLESELTLKQVKENEGRLLSRGRKLTFAGKRSGEGYFSADGKKIIYQSERLPENPFYQIYLLDLVTGETDLVSTGFGKTTCSWLHPIEEKALFASSHEDLSAMKKQKAELDFRQSGKARKYSWDYDEWYDIFEKDLNSGNLRNLTNARGYDAEGCYSPDGKLIVFASNRQAYERDLSEEEKKIHERDKSYFSEIYLMNSDGSNLRCLTNVAGYDGGPFFNADGTQICWRRFTENGHQAEIYVMNVDGSAQRKLTNLGKMSWAPFFHPSGKYLIFSTNVHGFQNFELYLVDAKGIKEPVRVTFTDGFDGLPCFSPDGQSLSWTSNRGDVKQSQIHLARWNHDAAMALLVAASEVPRLNKSEDLLESVTAKDSSPEIDPADARIHVEYLASEKLEGRFTGSQGARLASKYVASLFSSYGIETGGINRSWFQTFPFTKGTTLGKKNFLRIESKESIAFELDKNWRPIAFSDTATKVALDVVFAGYGLHTPAEDGFSEYDSYVHLDVKDKWVMILRYLPNGWEKKRKDKFAGHAALRKKASIARDLGAAGVLFVTGPNAENRKELVSFFPDTSGSGMSLLAASISDQLASNIFTIAGKELQSVQNILDKGEPVMGFPLKGIQLDAEIEIIREKGTGRNVLGWLRAGKKPSKRFIVIGAHIDHVGKGRVGSRAKKNVKKKIHPGADDNASGIAALLEIAQFLADLKKRGLLKMNYDVCFAAWSGEEIGLVGSSYYARELEKKVKANDENASLPIIAYLNLDMVGRYKDKLTLHGVGSGEGWLPIIEKANVPVGLNLNPQNDSHLPTDTTSFYSRGVPILSAFTGLHQDYHSPTDTADKLNYEAVADCGKLLSRITMELLQRDSPISYKSSPAPKRQSRGRLTAYLGTIPDYSQSDLKGVLLSGVAKGGPADEAGLRGGDVIISLAGKTVENVYDYTDAIGELKPKVASSIVVNRKGETLELDIIPKARD
ncbi:MAG: peptidase M28 [Opitutae bacterium]|nr:peptidase M28 [Opitutae bacterium]